MKFIDIKTNDLINNIIKIYELEQPMYPIKIQCIITSNDDLLVDLGYQDYNINKPIITYSNDFIGRFSICRDKDNDYCILLVFNENKNIKGSVISHECYHATIALLEHLGDTPEGKETEAYLNTALYDFCEAILNIK